MAFISYLNLVKSMSFATLFPFPGCHLACEGKFELYKKYTYFCYQLSTHTTCIMSVFCCV